VTIVSDMCEVLLHNERVNSVMEVDSRIACNSHDQCLWAFSTTPWSNLDVNTDFSDASALRVCSSSRGTEWYNLGMISWKKRTAEIEEVEIAHRVLQNRNKSKTTVKVRTRGRSR